MHQLDGRQRIVLVDGIDHQRQVAHVAGVPETGADVVEVVAPGETEQYSVVTAAQPPSAFIAQRRLRAGALRAGTRAVGGLCEAVAAPSARSARCEQNIVVCSRVTFPPASANAILAMTFHITPHRTRRRRTERCSWPTGLIFLNTVRDGVSVERAEQFLRTRDIPVATEWVPSILAYHVTRGTIASSTTPARHRPTTSSTSSR